MNNQVLEMSQDVPNVYFDEDNDAIMGTAPSQRSPDDGANGTQGHAANTLDWHFGQVFGERTPGEKIMDGMLC